MLRQIEHKIESLFEGIFGRAFRTHVQPVELARKLAKEMDEGKTVSVSRVYVPNEYSIFLAPDDREQFSSYEESLMDELQQYLAEHARREELRAPLRPADRLQHRRRPHRRRVRHRDAHGAAARRAVGAGAEPSATMIYRPAQQPTRRRRPRSSASSARS